MSIELYINVQILILLKNNLYTLCIILKVNEILSSITVWIAIVIVVILSGAVYNILSKARTQNTYNIWATIMNNIIIW